GYLQQENLTSTCQTFILESSNLKEYAEHCTDEGFIPACLLSLFGKNLTTILNEYVAMKAKARTRNGIAEIKRQRRLASQTAPVSSELLTLPYVSGQFTTSPLTATQTIRPASQISTPMRSNIVVVNHTQSQDTVTNGQPGQPPFCTSYQNEDALNALKNGSNHDVLRQEAQENFSQIGSNIQKKPFKTAVPPEQKCNLDITFESVPNLNDFNQRGNSDAECNQDCAELYTSHMPSETEMVIEVEKNSLSPNVTNESQLQSDQPDIPITSFVSLGSETNNENIILSGKSSQLLSQNTPLTGKPSKQSQFCDSSNNTVKLKTNFHGSKSPDSSEIHKSKIEINNIAVVSQLSDCQDNSSLQSKILPVSIESSSLNVSGQQVEICLEDSVSSIKQPSNDSTSIELNHLEGETKTHKSEKVILDSQEPSSSVKDDGDAVFLSLSGSENCGEVALMPPEDNPIKNSHSLPLESGCSSVGNSHPESQDTDDKPSSDNSTEMDTSNIVSLKIIISDDPFVSSDTELNSAVSSISGENLPTIILSSPAKSPAKNAELVKCLSSEETAGTVVSAEAGNSASTEQSLLAVKPEDSLVNSTQNEDGIAFSTNVTQCVSKDGGYIQLMPATSTTFGNSNNILIATCVTDPTTALGTTVSQSNVMVLPGNSAPIAAQPPPPQLQTPPRSNNVFAVNQAVSPNFSQGSAIIIASPVQPVLQGMVGMIPVSVVGQNGNTFSASPQQVLHMPLAAPVCNRSIPQFPVPPKSQKTQGLRNKPCTGKPVNNLADLSTHSVGCHAQRIEVSDKNMTTELGKKMEETTVPFTVESIVPSSKPFESHRRVLCFDSAASPMTNTQGPNHKLVSQDKERNETSFPHLDLPIVSSTLKPPSNNATKKEREKTPMPKILSKSEIAVSRHTTIRETQSEKKVSPAEMVLESFHKATANKENELCSDVERQKNPEASKLSVGQQNGSLRNEKTIASLQELTKKQATSTNSKSVISVGTAVKDLKQEQTKSASSLITTEILQDVQLHSPVNRLADSSDLPVPRTPGSGTGEKHKEEPTDGIKAPSSRRFGEDSSIPKVMIPPVTPDLPACSPASETGSENSVNMAAHTLMILSRAAISRTSSATPLKDNTQQFRTSSRSTTKKRKIEELDERERNSRSSSKNLTNSSIPMKKKKIKASLKLLISKPYLSLPLVLRLGNSTFFATTT
ncbi:Protein NPAT, partial [Sciurus carolinensis]|nr:Protein NPAT [Sciurus carolinensis]